MTEPATDRPVLTLTDVTDPGLDVDACAPAEAVEVMSESEAADTATALKALADPFRLRMLSYLTRTPEREACVCDLAELADVSQPTVSHHLKVLRDAGVLSSERRGTWVWYAIAPAYATSVATLLDSFATSLPRRP